MRILNIGDQVQCRNYYGKPKWKKGEIIKKIGKLHYLVQIDDTIVWKRHINQIIKIFNKTEKDKFEKGILIDQKFCQLLESSSEVETAVEDPVVGGISYKKRSETPTMKPDTVGSAPRRSNRKVKLSN